VTEAANVMRHWAQEHPAMTKAIMLFLGVGAGLLVLLGGLALAFGALTAAAAPLGIALGPLLLIVAGIAALAAAAYLVYDNWGPISAWFGGIWQGIRDMASGALAFLVNAFLTFTPLGLLVQAFAPALAYLQSLNFTEIGRNLIQGLINGITSMLGAVAATITGVGSSLVTLLKAKLGIHSPSRVFAGLGGFVMAGLDQGLADNTAGPLQRIASLSDAMTAGFRADGGATRAHRRCLGPDRQRGGARRGCARRRAAAPARGRARHRQCRPGQLHDHHQRRNRPGARHRPRSAQGHRGHRARAARAGFGDG
jgi:phage-related minor tail protein